MPFEISKLIHFIKIRLNFSFYIAVPDIMNYTLFQIFIQERYKEKATPNSCYYYLLLL